MPEVLLQEIISGRPPYYKEKGYVVDWARDYLEMPEVLSYVVDPELKQFSYDGLKIICQGREQWNLEGPLTCLLVEIQCVTILAALGKELKYSSAKLG